MRKTRKDKFTVKVGNHLDEFYMSYLTAEQIKSFTEKLETHFRENGKKAKKNKNELSKMVKIIKGGIDKYYIENRVEAKYIYFANLYELYNMLCGYFFKNSKFVEIEDYKPNIKEVSKVGLFGYETAFDLTINNRATDMLNRLQKIIEVNTKHYVDEIRVESKRRINKEIEKICTQETFVSTDEKKIRKEVVYINSILNRVDYARKNIGCVASDVAPNETDKKIKSNIKGTLTRIDNTIKMIIKEI